MITKLYIWTDLGRRKELPVYNRVEFDERLDEQLDSGQIQTINDSVAPFDGYSLYDIETTDKNGKVKKVTMFGFDTVEKRGEGYYIHTIELVEPTRVVMGLPIDGCKVTQPIVGDKKTLKSVVDELLQYKCSLHANEESNRLWVSSNINTTTILEKTISPEFHWECGTLLWECLCDIGNVINCIPRVEPMRMDILEGNPVHLYISFDPINDITAEYDL